MATTTKTSKSAKGLAGRRSSAGTTNLSPLKTESVGDFAARAMYIYGSEVNEDRAIPSYQDGLKPVQRRLLWAASRVAMTKQKSALPVSEAMGRFHPHGDVGIYGALVNMVNNNVPIITGLGGWGSLIDPPSAMRYCFVGSTRVVTEKGLLKFATLAQRSSIADRDSVPFKIKVDTKSEPENTSHFVNSGMQNVVRVTTTSGYSTVCTPNEPFYVITEDGFRWKQADELVQGDHVCMKRGTQMRIKGSHNLDVRIARFLGYLVGDGYMNHGQGTIGFSQVRDDAFKDFLDSAKATLPDYKSKFNVSKIEPNSYGKQISNLWTLNSIEARRSLAKYGLKPGDSYDRVIPESVFQGSSEFAKAFLQSLFESDGSVFGENTQIVFDSRSEQLLDEVSLMLRSYFGIFANKVASCDAKRLSISGADNIDRFARYVGFRSSDKNERLVVNQDALNGTTAGGGTRDYVPFSRELGFGGSLNTRRTNFREKVKSGKLTSGAAQMLYERDYYYERVASITDAGEAQVWDLTVPGSHSFVADGFVVHNTNCLLSKFGAEFIRKEYLAVTPRVPNYDSTMTEPLYLPALLPNILMNPSSGIGVGVRSDIPAYTPKSLITMCVRVLNNEKLTPADWAKGLEFHEPWGGKLLRTKVNMAALRSFYETGNGSISFYAPVSLDETKKQIAIKYFVPGVRIESSDKKRNEKTATGNGKGAEQGLGLIDKIRRIAQVENVYTDGGLSYVVQIRRTTNMNECELLLKRIQTMLTAKQSFNVFTTVRKPAAEESYAVKFFNVAVPEVLVMWLKFRIKLEVDSLNWRIGEQEAAIAYTELLILVCSGLDKLIEILKRRLKDKDELRLAIQKAYKITSEQAKMVMVLQVHQLSRVDLDQQQLKLKEQQAELKSLQRDVKRPVHVVRTYLEAMADRFVLFNETNPQQQQWVLK